MSNAKWRTPGSDGGRDVEGEVVETDFSGHLKAERPYIECKRYSSAIDWPTAHNKLSYALNQGADCLLIVTTSNLSTQCRDQVGLWNRNQRRPLVRDWSAAELEQIVSREPIILAKYLAASSGKEKKAAALPLLTMVSKATQEIFGEAALKGTPTPAVEFAAGLAEFAADWMSRDGVGPGATTSRLDESRDIPAWCDVRTRHAISLWSPHAIRALLTTVRMFLGIARLAIYFRENAGLRTLRMHPKVALNDRLRKAGRLICSMADFEWTDDGTVVTVTDRNL